MEAYAITNISGIGKKRAELLKKAGIETLNDLLDYFPRNYLDLSNPVKIKELNDGDSVFVSAVVCSAVIEKRIKNLVIYKFDVSDINCEDNFGSISRLTIKLFNQKFLASSIKEGMLLHLIGKVNISGFKAEMTSPIIEFGKDFGFKAIYPLKNGISQTLLRNAFKTLFFGKFNPDFESDEITLPAELAEETLPQTILDKYKLCSKAEAYLKIHFPKSMEDVETAKRRLAFEELFIFQTGLLLMKKRIKTQKAPPLSKDSDMQYFYGLLPFELTFAQKRVISEALEDFKKPCPMSRIVQGDVGSGKTIVAAALFYHTKKNGFQSCLMVPTEILAIQHYNDLTPLLNNCGLRLALLTGSTTAKEKKRIKQELAAGEIDLLIGTHALIENSVEFKNLALAITDEQHRFGVRQRALLSEKGEEGLSAHVLVMSATPIPRTLALILYGDLDISVIDEMPKGRKKVSTFLLDSSYNQRMYQYIKKEAQKGFQAYVVCPLVEEGEDENLKAVTAFADEIRRKYLDGINVEFLHGKMSGKEKDKLLKAFTENKISVLVSTTVIEVGVNVPNSTIMIIQNAERFGLSQLHQLRGRVGRGSKKSYCFLISDSKNEQSIERLKAFCKTNDGFEISKKDLEIRGPGDFFGKRQHGLPEFKVADIVNDANLITYTKVEVQKLTQDPEWYKKEEYAALKSAIIHFFERNQKENISDINI